jgi:RimJ/RimL family protein N-acetyltransferase
MHVIQLLPIDRNGRPAAVDGRLPELARDVCLSSRLLYDLNGFEPPWIGYLAQIDEGVVGTCAFKAPPRLGRVEIAYFTFPEFEGRGFAQAMARELLAIAARLPGLVVVAQTLPEENASNGVLRRLGFTFAGQVEHPEDGPVWEWQRRAAAGD